jgi:hypothetical protein
MKKQLLAIALLHSAVYAHAQTPHAIPYQAAARTSSGAVIASQPVGVRFTIRDSAATGAVLYSETHSPTTTAQGLFTVQIGQGTPVTGSFSGINWGHNAKYLQVELDASGGTTYTHIGTQQLLSVPYALYAENAGGTSGWADSAGLLHNINATGRVGIGTSVPAARLHVADSSVVFTGASDIWGVIPGDPPVSGEGTRMMWYADKAAFRAGYVDNNEWDNINTGRLSVATGFLTTASADIATAMGSLSVASGGTSTALGAQTLASGDISTAMGFATIASGGYSTAMGELTTASGEYSTAMGLFQTSSGDASTTMGQYNVASGVAATAIGSNTTASGISSFAAGQNATASGDYATAIGRGSYASTEGATAIGSYVYATNANATAIGIGNTASAASATALGIGVTANGPGSTAIGNHVRTDGEGSMAMGIGTSASGDYSTAMGANASTNNKTGSFAIGDNNSELTRNDTDNQMVMRFAGGYKLYNDTFATKGIHITPSGPVKYLTNVTALFDDRSLVDKHYVDSVAAGGSTTSNWATAGTDAYNTNTGRIGIGTSTPKARLHVADSSVVFTANGAALGIAGNPPVSGEGRRMMWYADKAAFRAGYVEDSVWNNLNTGVYSVAFGRNCKASGHASTAFGWNTNATSGNTTAIGNFTNATGYNAFAGDDGAIASGISSIAFGLNTKASGLGSIAFGNATTSTGASSTVSGNESFASGASSFAVGYRDTATGFGAIALGQYSYASGERAFACGYGTKATGVASVAIGDFSQSSGSTATAIGVNCQAIGNAAVAIGVGANAPGYMAIALGNGCNATATTAYCFGASVTASGERAISIGNSSTASGYASLTLGSYVSTDNKTGAFAIGDYSSSFTTVNSTADNQMTMRFAGGYRLFTNSTSTVGVSLAAGGNSWATISDKRKKENFRPIDGNGILKKIGSMQLSSWNYRGQDPKTYRHYGPMAQDFYAAFGNDGVGTVGNDTTINQADMAGVTFAAVQALVKKVEELTKQNEQLAKQNAGFIKHVANLEKQSVQCSKDNEILKAELQKTKTDVDSRLEQMEMMIRQQQTAKK